MANAAMHACRPLPAARLGGSIPSPSKSNLGINGRAHLGGPRGGVGVVCVSTWAARRARAAAGGLSGGIIAAGGSSRNGERTIAARAVRGGRGRNGGRSSWFQEAEENNAAANAEVESARAAAPAPPAGIEPAALTGIEPAPEPEPAPAAAFKSSLFDDASAAAAFDSSASVETETEEAAADVGDIAFDWSGVKDRSGDGADVDPFAPSFLDVPDALEAQPTPSPTSLAVVDRPAASAMVPAEEEQASAVRSFLYPGEDQLPDDVNMSIWEHLEELRDRALVSAGAVAAMILVCFCFAKDLVLFLEAPVAQEGVRFLQLGPGEYFFTTVKVAGYCGLLLGAPVVLYEAIAYVLPGLTRDERKFLGPIVLGSSVLFYTGIGFAYAILTPAALKFFIGYSNEAVESLWSIDQYFEFVLVLLFSTGLAFQVPVLQLLLGQSGIVTSKQMLSVWRYVVVGSVVAAAVLTPSTDPFTQMLLAVPLMSLYLGGAALVGVVEKGRGDPDQLEA